MERVQNGNGDQMERFINTYAYPINDIGKNAKMKRLLMWCKENEVYGLGRWGEHQHYNSDVTVEKAMQLGNILCQT